MPLKKGSSAKTISTNIRHCIDNYKKTGRVSGNSVGSMKKAMEICSAMAYSSARSSADSSALSNAIRRKRK